MFILYMGRWLYMNNLREPLMLKIIYTELSTYDRSPRWIIQKKILTLIWLSLKQYVSKKSYSLTNHYICSQLEKKDFKIIRYTHFRPNIMYLNCCLPFIYALLIKGSNQVWHIMIVCSVILLHINTDPVSQLCL